MSEKDLEKKAAAGDTEAQCSLGFLYEIGLDRPQDYEKAAHFWHMAATEGHQLALEKLRALCTEGKISSDWLKDFNDLELARDKSKRSSPKSDLGQKILLLEDEEDLRDLITETLQMAGYRVVAAADGEEGLQKMLSNVDVALIISDLKMPKMNGLQFLKTIRKMQYETPVIVMTAYSQQKVIDEGLKLGIKSWIVKPVRRDALLENVQKILERKSAIA